MSKYMFWYDEGEQTYHLKHREKNVGSRKFNRI